MRFSALLGLLLVLAACSRPHPPIGKWEGGYEGGGVLVAARVEILADGSVRVSAPDFTDTQVSSDQTQALQAQLTADLANGWSAVEPRSFDFDGKTFRKPGGVAPQMIWDKQSNQLTLELYIGARPGLGVTLRPVHDFHDDPFVSG